MGDLRLILEEGSAIPLRYHQCEVVWKFRQDVEAGAEGVSRISLVIRNRLRPVYYPLAVGGIYCFF